MLRLLGIYLVPQWRHAAILGVVLLGSSLLQLAGPQVLRAFVDGVSRPNADLTLLALLFIGIALAQQLAALAATFVGERVGWRATNELRADLALHCLRLDLGFHKRRTPGEMVERIDGDVTSLATFFSQMVVDVLGSVVVIVGVVVALWLEDWRAGVAMALFALVVLAATARMRDLAAPHWAAFRQAGAELFGFIEERLNGTEDLRASGAPAYALRRLYEYTRERLRAGRRARLVATIPWGVPIVLFALGTAASFLVAASLYVEGAITLGTAFLLYSYTQLLWHPFERLTRHMEEFQKAVASIGRVTELLAIRSEIVDGPDAASRRDGALSVEFDDVSFGYGEEEMVLENVSFRLAPGTVLGLLGRTGSGKTTIARLLFRLYDPATGSVRLDGVDVARPRLSDLRERVGMVTQDVQVFNATVRDNVTFFDRDVSDDRLLAALDALGLSEWLARLPDGLDTTIGAGGIGLSAGEAQLLAFARVFLKDPGLVVLDEASSRLDPATERLIERAVDRLMIGRTAIVIAHRLPTVDRADEILVMDEGRVLEHGRRVALAADPTSRFASLLRSGIEQVLA